jgi:hypothetical protein
MITTDYDNAHAVFEVPYEGRSVNPIREEDFGRVQDIVRNAGLKLGEGIYLGPREHRDSFYVASEDGKLEIRVSSYFPNITNNTLELGYEIDANNLPLDVVVKIKQDMRAMYASRLEEISLQSETRSTHHPPLA